MTPAPNYTMTATGPADYGWPITPDDDTDLARPTRQVFAAGGGVIKWLNQHNADVQHTTVAPGERVPIKARRILATGTTATGLEGLA